MTETSNAMKIPVHLGYLSGPAGNAYAIIGAVNSSAKQLSRAGMPISVDHIVKEMTSGDYDHLLDTVLKYCDDLDGSIAALRDKQEWDDDED